MGWWEGTEWKITNYYFWKDKVESPTGEKNNSPFKINNDDSCRILNACYVAGVHQVLSTYTVCKNWKGSQKTKTVVLKVVLLKFFAFLNFFAIWGMAVGPHFFSTSITYTADSSCLTPLNRTAPSRLQLPHSRSLSFPVRLPPRWPRSFWCYTAVQMSPSTLALWG